MTTIVTSSIGTTGTYATIAAWWAAIPANLVTADEVHIGELQNQVHNVGTTVALTGKTVDAARYIELTAAAGASWVDTPSNPIGYGFGARVEGAATSSNAVVLVSGGQTLRMRRFQIKNTSTGVALQASISGAGFVTASQMYMTSGTTSASTGVANFINGSVIQQCVFVRGGGTSSAAIVYTKSPMYGSTLVSLSGTTPTAGVRGDSSTNVVLKNCAVFGATALVGGTNTWSISNVRTSSASPPAGATQTDFSTSTGAKFLNLTSDVDCDLKVAADSSLVGAGVQDLTFSTTDVFGVTRGNPPTVGAFEVVAVGGDTTPPTITGPTGAAGATSISLNVAENATAVGTWAANETVTWSLTGADAARFSITSGGVVTFVAAPDFEAPVDAGANNVYNFNVVATDAATNASSQAVTLTVTNVNPETAPGTPGGLSAITVSTCTAAVTLGAAVDAATYEARINDGLGGALGGAYTAFATTASTWAGIVPGRTYSIEWRGINGIGAGSTSTGTFRVDLGAPTVDGSTFVAALIASLGV